MSETMCYCIPLKVSGEGCPYLPYCLAVLNDPTIIGCTLPLYLAGIVDEIHVKHRTKKEPDKE